MGFKVVNKKFLCFDANSISDVEVEKYSKPFWLAVTHGGNFCANDTMEVIEEFFYSVIDIHSGVTSVENDFYGLTFDSSDAFYTGFFYCEHGYASIFDVFQPASYVRGALRAAIKDMIASESCFREDAPYKVSNPVGDINCAVNEDGSDITGMNSEKWYLSIMDLDDRAITLYGNTEDEDDGFSGAVQRDTDEAVAYSVPKFVKKMAHLGIQIRGLKIGAICSAYRRNKVYMVVSAGDVTNMFPI